MTVTNSPARRVGIVKPVTRRPLIKTAPVTNPVKVGTRKHVRVVSEPSVNEDINVTSIHQNTERELLLWKYLQHHGFTKRDLWLTGAVVAVFFLLVIITIMIFKA